MGGLRQRFQDHAAYAFDLFQNRIIPETQEEKACPPQPAIAPEIARRSSVLAAVDFDDETPFQADEIDDAWADRALPPETMTRQLPVPEMSPELLLGVGHVSMQPTRGIAFLAFPHAHAPMFRHDRNSETACEPFGCRETPHCNVVQPRPHPNPPPQAGEGAKATRLFPAANAIGGRACGERHLSTCASAPSAACGGKDQRQRLPFSAANAIGRHAPCAPRLRGRVGVGGRPSSLRTHRRTPPRR